MALRLEYEIATSGTNRLVQDFRKIETELDRMSRRGAAREVSEEKERLKIIDKEYRAQQKALAKEEADKARARAKEIREEERATKAKERIEERSLRYRQQIRQRYFAEQQRERERADRATFRDRELLRRGTSNAVKGIVGGTARTLGSWGTTAGTLALAGSGFAVHSAVQQYRTVDAGLRGVANSGYIEGTPKQREEIYKAAKGAVYEAAKTGTDPTALIAGMQEILAKTGNISAAMNIGAVEQLATATSTGIEDMARTFGSSFRSLMETNPNMTAAEANAGALQLARAFAGQGKFGAVEVSDVARQGGKLIGSASRFGGDRSSNIETMGTMVQQAIIGGATTAEDAATAVKSIPTDLMYAVRLKKADGTHLKEKDLLKDGKFKDLRELLPMIFAAAKGSQMKLFGPEGGVFGAQSIMAITPFLDKWREAGGGEAGAAAVRKIFDDYAKQTMSEKEVSDSYAFINKGDQRQSDAAMIEFNKELGERLGPELKKLTPKLKELVPAIAKIAEKFVSFADFAIENPLAGFGAVVAAAATKEIATAGIGKSISWAIEKIVGKAIGDMPGGSGIPIPGGGKGGGRGLGGAPLIWGLGGLAAGVAGLALWNEYQDSEEAKAHNKSLVGYGKQSADALNSGSPEQVQKALAGLQSGAGFSLDKGSAVTAQATAKIDDPSIAKIQAALVAAVQSIPQAGPGGGARTDPIVRRGL